MADAAEFFRLLADFAKVLCVGDCRIRRAENQAERFIRFAQSGEFSRASMLRASESAHAHFRVMRASESIAHAGAGSPTDGNSSTVTP